MSALGIRVNSHKSALPALCALVCLLLLAGCGPVRDQRTDLDLSLAQSSWAGFTELSANASKNSAPHNMQLSVRYRSPEKSQRFGAYMWNNSGASPYPIRLEIMGAMGSVAAKLLETSDSFVIYDTENNTALLAAQVSSGSLLQMGLPLPMRLGDLSLLLSGRYQEFFLPGVNGDMPRLIASALSRQSTFRIEVGPRAGLLTLDQAGRPVLWTELHENGWRIEITYLEGAFKGTLPGPQKVTVSHPQGYSISLLVKAFNRQREEYSPEQLNLIIPEGAIIKTLAPPPGRAKI